MIYDLDFPAKAAFAEIDWPESAAVARAIHLFTVERAPTLPSGKYPLRAVGFAMQLQVDREAGTVLVLYVVRAR